MVKLKVISNHWEVIIEVGNDWGEPSYTETRRYKDKEEVMEELKHKDYYEIIHSIREVVEYERVHEDDED